MFHKMFYIKHYNSIEYWESARSTMRIYKNNDYVR